MAQLAVYLPEFLEGAPSGAGPFVDMFATKRLLVCSDRAEKRYRWPHTFSSIKMTLVT